MKSLWLLQTHVGSFYEDCPYLKYPKLSYYVSYVLSILILFVIIVLKVSIMSYKETILVSCPYPNMSYSYVIFERSVKRVPHLWATAFADTPKVPWFIFMFPIKQPFAVVNPYPHHNSVYLIISPWTTMNYIMTYYVSLYIYIYISILIIPIVCKQWIS